MHVNPNYHAGAPPNLLGYDSPPPTALHRTASDEELEHLRRAPTKKSLTHAQREQYLDGQHLYFQERDTSDDEFETGNAPNAFNLEGPALP